MNVTMTKSSSSGERRIPRTYALGERVFLAVPSHEVREALKMGAQWDRAGRVCYIHVNADRAPFARWIVDDAALSAAGLNRADVIADFRDAMQSYGLVPVEPVPDGQWHCAPLTTDKGSKIHQTHGGYRLSLDGVPHGVIRNFKGRTGSWRYQGARLSRVQLAAIDAQNKEREALRQQQVEAEQKAVADRILQILVPLEQASGHVHGYLEKKGVRAHGLRIADGGTDDMAGLLNMPKFKPGNAKWLVIPGRDVYDNLLTAQAIDPRGNKVFASGARKKGAFHVIGVRRARELALAPAVLFCEGYATGASLHESTGLPVVVAFDSGNLVEVARQFAPVLPADQPKLVCGDNDQFFLEKSIDKVLAVGLNPAAKPETLGVLAGVNDATREITLTGLLADGQWHEGHHGKYRIALHVERHIVSGVTVDVVQKGKGHVRQTVRNAGIEAAQEAARILNGKAIAPFFASLDGRPTDFNDLEDREGSSRVVEIIQAELTFSLPLHLAA
ncbi:MULTISPECIES: DUF5710 domain-containing protein [Paraburkholderia]|uniref:DUF5710 domain-containing protein n=1 Tax=Paraburkholderia madseniana TaxID=2599607 RepID=A0AAP5F0V4_9BURK|nr:MULTISPECIES: DUF5710 domain-containing protein [Paraburkholderia]MCX4150992.1 DUF5710 domain-containing protein [Paraburkholderia madseniana]MCX4176632.1 DUF5710 domain-containing protein [Paraburkholderia madseniana]MDN7153925.1 DUF5710 domain-containing protein [Paraburkholderia sp. WS6]MDQ6412807.1 DUF5710 domain-containing protein [Paraburkholderia madseniana]MDQ6464624.1 DUF5710 domain-containing protein [Paraburkholderia madseniana]